LLSVKKMKNKDQIKKIFIEVASILESESKWTQLWKARDEINLACNALSKNACKFSVEGALIKVLFNNKIKIENPIYDECFDLLVKSLGRSHMDKVSKLQQWNDDSSFKDVQNLFTKILKSLE